MSNPSSSHRRRPVLAFLPALVASWALVAGLPFAPTPGAPGRLEVSTVVLTGRKAVPLPPAGRGQGRASGHDRAGHDRMVGRRRPR